MTDEGSSVQDDQVPDAGGLDGAAVRATRFKRIVVAVGLLLSAGVVLAFCLLVLLPPKPGPTGHGTKTAMAKTAAAAEKTAGAYTTAAAKNSRLSDSDADDAKSQQQLPSGGDAPDSQGAADSSAGSSNSGSASGSSGGAQVDPHAGQVWHPGWDEQVWVDTSHYESVWVPEQGYYGSRCNTCGADISGFAGQHIIDTGHVGYSGDVWFQTAPAHEEQQWVSSGYYETINHPGYWG
jgi:hypothetical protein